MAELIAEEANAILYDLVQAVAEWRAAGKQLGQPEPVANASSKYLTAQDPLVEWLDSCFVHTDDGSLASQTEELPLKVFYWSFLMQSGRADSNAFYQQFGDMLISKGFTKRVAYDGKRFTSPISTPEARTIADDAVWEADMRRKLREH